MNLFVLFTLLLAAFQVRADISCQPDGTGFVPKNGAIRLGKPGFFFGTDKECKDANPDPKAVAGCSWNGTYYSPYSAVDGALMGGVEANYSTAKDCKDSIAEVKNGKLCLWNNDGGWQPFSVTSRKFLGTSGYGFKNRSECVTTIALTSEKYACNWNGSYYSLYSSATNTTVDGIGAHYSTPKDCADSINEVHSGKVCFWNSAGWQPFSLKTSKFPGKTGFGFKDRKECLTSIKSTREKFSCNWNGADYSLYSAANPDSDFSVMTFLTVAYCQDYISKLGNSTSNVSAISETELLKEFFPKPTQIGYSYTECHDPNFSYHIVKRDAAGALPDQCFPDTLYSWGDYGKVSWFRERYEKAGDWDKPFERDFYLTQSPMATFGYGPVPLRIKLKPSAKPRLTVQNEKRLSCKDLTVAEKKDTVIINQWSNGIGTGVDYLLCSMGPVESWSYGTRQHFDEIIKDSNWIATHNHKDYELYYKVGGVDSLWDSGLDSHDFSRTTFVKHMRNIRQLIELKLGGIFYQDAGGKEADHYKTKKPIYYNPE